MMPDLLDGYYWVNTVVRLAFCLLAVRLYMRFAAGPITNMLKLLMFGLALSFVLFFVRSFMPPGWWQDAMRLAGVTVQAVAIVGFYWKSEAALKKS